MQAAARFLTPILIATALAACSGGTEAPLEKPGQSGTSRARQASAAAGPHAEAVQQLYLAYFGRPADSAGQAYFEGLLQGAGAPVAMPAIAGAYASNEKLRAVVEIFSGSQESKDLYGGGTAYFVDSVYRNLFNRNADDAGKKYWVAAIDGGQLSRAAAAMTILSGAQSFDAEIVKNKTAAAASFTAALTANGATALYSGMGANAIARDMLSQVNEWTDLGAFQATVTSTAGVVKAPYLMVSPAQAGATVYQGQRASVRLIATARFTPVTFYPQLSDRGSALASSPYASSWGWGPGELLYIELNSRADLAPGRHSGTVELRMCIDQACTSQRGGSPVLLPYEFNVLPATSLTPLARWQGISEWETFQGNAGHNGFVPVSLDPAQFSQRWRWSPPLPAGQEYPSMASPVVTQGGRVLFTVDNKLVALNEHDASTAWSVAFGTGSFDGPGTPAASNGKIYVQSGENGNERLYGLDGASGAQLFSSYTSGKGLQPTVGEGLVYTGSSSVIRAFDAAGGKEVWNALHYGNSNFTPTLANGKVYSYTADLGGDTLAAYAPLTGAPSGSMYDNGPNDMGQIDGAAVDGGGNILFGVNRSRSGPDGYANTNRLLKFDMAGGAIAWAIPGSYVGAPAVAADVVYVANHRPFQLEARAASNGALLWKWARDVRTDFQGFSGQVLATNRLLFATTPTMTYAIDIATRRTAWSYPLGGALAISPNGILYISGNGSIAAINLR